jgi:hypothetical protein
MLHCISHWPFCPGVFIGILGFVAVVVTFRLTPDTKKGEKVFWVILCFGLMWGEIWMMSKDRDKHDSDEREARQQSEQLSGSIALLVTSVNREEGHWLEIKDKIRRTTDPAALAILKNQADEAQKRANDAARQLAITIAPTFVNQLDSLGHQWYREEDAAFSYHAPYTADEGQKVRATIAQKYSSQARPLLVSADYLRVQLLALLGTPQTSEDKSAALIFARAAAGESLKNEDLFNASVYLQNLVKRLQSHLNDFKTIT